MMTLERLKWLASSYGADLERWPEQVRQDARNLLNTSHAARAILARAQVLDETITAAAEVEHSQNWPRDEAAAALARLRSHVAARIAEREPASSRRRLVPSLSSFVSTLLNPLQSGWGGLLTGGVIAITAGLAIGLLYTSGPPPVDVLLLLEPAPLSIFSDTVR
jgi:hypothetical protein